MSTNYESTHTGSEIDEAVTWAKQGKDSGKVLSTNDYTNAEKQKLANIDMSEKADKNGSSSVSFSASQLKVGTSSYGGPVVIRKNQSQMDGNTVYWLNIHHEDESAWNGTFIPVSKGQGTAGQIIVPSLKQVEQKITHAAGATTYGANILATRSWTLTQIANAGGGGGGSIDLSDYATISMLSDYATKEYVDDAIANAEGGGGADLTGYATQEWCNMNFMKPDNTYTISQVDSLLSAKQNTLVSGTNVKTINGESILVEGRDTDVTLNGGNIAYPNSGSVSSFRGKSIEQCLNSLNGKANKQGSSTVPFSASTSFADKFSITNSHDSSYVGNVEIRQFSDGNDTIVEMKDGGGNKIAFPFGQTQLESSYNSSEVIAKRDEVESLHSRVSALESGTVKFKVYASVAAMNADATNYDEGEAVIAYCGTSEFYILNTSTQTWHPFAPEP